MAMSEQDAIKKYTVELLKKLPLEDEIFFGMAESAGLFPMDTGNKVRAKDTRASKVSFFLTQMTAGADIYLPKLLGVMKDKDAPADVVELANTIEAAMGLGKSNMFIKNSVIINAVCC